MDGRPRPRARTQQRSRRPIGTAQAPRRPTAALHWLVGWLVGWASSRDTSARPHNRPCRSCLARRREKRVRPDPDPERGSCWPAGGWRTVAGTPCGAIARPSHHGVTRGSGEKEQIAKVSIVDCSMNHLTSAPRRRGHEAPICRSDRIASRSLQWNTPIPARPCAEGRTTSIRKSARTGSKQGIHGVWRGAGTGANRTDRASPNGAKRPSSCVSSSSLLE
jgi:hypothetical protein